MRWLWLISLVVVSATNVVAAQAQDDSPTEASEPNESAIDEAAPESSTEEAPAEVAEPEVAEPEVTEPAPEAEVATPEPELPTDPDARARALYQRGDLAYSEGRLEEAIDDFRAAYELSGRPLLLFNIANAFERLGSYRSTVDALRRYREVAPEAERSTLDRRIDSLEQRIEERDRRGRPAPPPPIEPNLLPTTILAIGAGVTVLSGVAFAIAATVARDDAREHCVELDRGLICDQRADAALARDEAFSLTADILFGVGAAAAVGAIVWWLVEVNQPSETPPETAPTVDILASPDHAQLRLQLSI